MSWYAQELPKLLQVGGDSSGWGRLGQLLLSTALAADMAGVVRYACRACMTSMHDW